MAKTRAVPGAESNPAFLRNVTGGDKGAHSSEVPSTDHAVEADHAQFDEASQNIPPQTDPNLSGTTPTETPISWMAGPMNAWQENDDYREFGPGQMRAPESATTHRYDRIEDGDYDDNGGMPLAEGHSRGNFSSAYRHPADSQVVGLNAVIVRRF